jgi:DNA-binding NarL/FixJ family response regulator
MTRVLLADDHALVRAGLRSVLAGVPDVEVVGEAGDGNEAVALAAELKPDLVLMDISMPELNGLEATRRVLKLKPAPRVLIVSMHADKEYVRRALRAGASGYLLKTADLRELTLAIAVVTRGEAWISPGVARTVVDELVRGQPDPESPEVLTPRQREILQLVAEGRSTKQIARRLHISVKTVDTHRAQIMERLGIRHIAGLIRYAIRAGMVAREE